MNDSPRVALVGFTVQDEVLQNILAVDRYMPIQTQKLSKAILAGLRANECVVDLISSEPVGIYPANPRILFRGRKWREKDGTQGTSTTFVNLHILRDITRFVSCLRHLLAWSRRTKAPRVIFLYGAHTAHALASLLVSRLLRLRLVMFLTDPPSEPLPGEGFFLKLLRRVDRAILRRLTRAAHGIIGVTDEFSTCAGEGKPFLRLEGIVAETDRANHTNECKPANRTTFLYAGALEAAYGVRLLLDAFSSADTDDCELWLAGKGSMGEEVKAAASKNHRVRYFGFVSPTRVNELVRSAHFLINARPAGQAFTKFSFPSKVLQFLASGTPVISSRLAGIPAEYWDHMIALPDDTVQGVCDTIRKVRGTEYSQHRHLGLRAQSFVLTNKSAVVQGKCVVDFLRKVVG